MLLLLFFFTGGVGEDGDGCSRWSVAGGDDGELLRMQGRLFQCVRDQTEQIDTFYFYFCIFNFFYYIFCYFLPCIDIFYLIFVFFMFTIFGIPDIERRKKKEESSHRPATRIPVFLWLAYLKINS